MIDSLTNFDCQEDTIEIFLLAGQKNNEYLRISLLNNKKYLIKDIDSNEGDDEKYGTDVFLEGNHSITYQTDNSKKLDKKIF